MNPTIIELALSTLDDLSSSLISEDECIQYVSALLEGEAHDSRDALWYLELIEAGETDRLRTLLQAELSRAYGR